LRSGIEDVLNVSHLVLSYLNGAVWKVDDVGNSDAYVDDAK